ncbi:DMT family transporter [Bdellovibrio bacteriovorus]
MMKTNPRLRGIIEISIASLGFGFLGIFGKWAFASGLSVGELLSYRFALAAVLIWIFLLLFKPDWVRLSAKQIGLSALLGIFGYAVFSTLYFEAIKGVSVTLAAMLLYTYPFWVNIFSHFFTHDKISRKEALCLAAALMGLVLLLWGHIEIHSVWAVAAGLGSAIAYAIYVLLSGRYQQSVRPITSTLYVITFGALALAAFHQPNFSELKELSQYQATYVLGIAIVCTIIPLTLVLSALQKLRSKEVALLTMMEPVTAAFMGAMIFHESLSPSQLLGALIIAAALVFNTLSKKKS